MKNLFKAIVTLNIVVIIALTFTNPFSGYSAQPTKRWNVIQYPCNTPYTQYMYVTTICYEDPNGPWTSCTDSHCTILSW